MPMTRLHALIGCLLCAGCASVGPAVRSVPHEQEGRFVYLNFVANWDSKVSSAQFACVRTTVEYDRIFHPAGVMGARKPHHPRASFFNDRQMLVVCRTGPGGATLFTLQGVEETDGELTVRYGYAGRTDLESGYKDTLNVYVPKKDYARIRFVENGQVVRILDLGAGQWAFPTAHPSWREQVRGRPWE